jgi:hypothetical protein
MADAQSNRPHRPKKEKKPHTGDKNPKAFAYAAPGKLKRQAARSTEVCKSRSCALSLLTFPGQRKAPPRTARRPSSRRSSPNYCRRRWPPWCRKNHSHQELDQTIHQADPLCAHRPSHSSHLEAQTPYVPRMSRRLARQHDRHCESSGHSVVVD